MRVNIYEDNHLNKRAVFMENDKIRLAVLPDLGFKIASMVYRPLQKEIFFQPVKGFYENPLYGADFTIYDTSGCDDMLPTIDSCPYIGDQSIILPDHGSVWARRWDYRIIGNTLQGSIALSELPMTLTKTLSYVDSHRLRIDYRLTNNSVKDICYLWALHPLCVFEDETVLLLPKGVSRLVNVQKNPVLGEVGDLLSFPVSYLMHDNELYIQTESGLDLRKLSDYQDKLSYKFYVNGELLKGCVGLFHQKDDLVFQIQYDEKQIPYLGIWLNKGGLKGEYNIAIEPSNGFYDSLELASKNHKIESIPAQSVVEWSLMMSIMPREKANMLEYALE